MCWIQHQKLRMMEPRFKLGFAVKTEPTKHATIFLGTNSSPTRPPSYTRHWKSPCVYVCVCEDLKNLFWDSQLRRNVLFGFGFSSRLRHNERRLARAQRRPSTRNFATASPSIQDKTKRPLLRLFCANGHQEPSVDCTFHGNNVKFTAPTKDLLIPVIFLAPQDYRRKHEIDRNIFWAKRPPRRITWPLPTRNFHKGLVDQTCMTSMTTMTSIADSAPHTTSPLPIDSEPDRIPKTLTELFQMKRQGNMLHPATKRRYQQSNFSNFETKWL